MTKPFRTQMDLFATPARFPELAGADRQKAVALLRALLTEALVKPADGPSPGSRKDSGHD